MKISEELEQLLKNLHLETHPGDLRRTGAGGPEGGRPLRRVPHPAAARAVARPAGERPGVAHPARQPARALVSGNFPLRPPTGRQPQTDSHLSRTGVHRQGGKYRLHRRNRPRQNRLGLWSAAEGAGERLPRPVRPRPGPLRRNVCLAGRSFHPPVAQTPGAPGRPSWSTSWGI